MMVAADLFSGLGGFTEGAAQCGVPVKLAANHWEAACYWHKRNHPETIHLQQDLAQMDMRALIGVSLIIAAPECQGHSQNGQPARRGTGGNGVVNLEEAHRRTILQRSTTWAVIAAAEVARPDTILVENVPDLYRWDLFRSWRGALEALGYSVRTHVIKALNYGSCQDRSRAIITAHQGKPIELATHWGSKAGPVGDCIDLQELPEHRWSIINEKPERMRRRMRKAQNEAGRVCLWNNVSESSGRPLEGSAPTLTTKSGSQLYLLDGERGRILNPRELARIQGFPDSYEIPSQRGLASHLIGNAIDVRIARGVIEQTRRAAA